MQLRIAQGYESNQDWFDSVAVLLALQSRFATLQIHKGHYRYFLFNIQYCCVLFDSTNVWFLCIVSNLEVYQLADKILIVITWKFNSSKFNMVSFKILFITDFKKKVLCYTVCFLYFYYCDAGDFTKTERTVRLRTTVCGLRRVLSHVPSGVWTRNTQRSRKLRGDCF